MKLDDMLTALHNPAPPKAEPGRSYLAGQPPIVTPAASLPQNDGVNVEGPAHAFLPSAARLQALIGADRLAAAVKAAEAEWRGSGQRRRIEAQNAQRHLVVIDVRPIQPPHPTYGQPRGVTLAVGAHLDCAAGVIAIEAGTDLSILFPRGEDDGGKRVAPELPPRPPSYPVADL